MFKFAENLLNNLDQTTQSTVQNVRKSQTDSFNVKASKHSKNKSFTTNHVQNITDINKPTTSISASNSSANMNTFKQVEHAKNSSPSKKKQKQDEELFENFLNSPEKVDVPSVKTSSTNSLEKAESLTEENVKFIVGDKSNKPSDNEESANLDESFEVKEESGPTEAAGEGGENVKNYKNEIVSLNEEIKSLMRQIKTSQNGN